MNLIKDRAHKRETEGRAYIVAGAAVLGLRAGAE